MLFCSEVVVLCLFPDSNSIERQWVGMSEVTWSDYFLQVRATSLLLFVDIRRVPARLFLADLQGCDVGETCWLTTNRCCAGVGDLWEPAWSWKHDKHSRCLVFPMLKGGIMGDITIYQSIPYYTKELGTSPPWPRSCLLRPLRQQSQWPGHLAMEGFQWMIIPWCQGKRWVSAELPRMFMNEVWARSYPDVSWGASSVC